MSDQAKGLIVMTLLGIVLHLLGVTDSMSVSDCAHYC